MTNSLTSCLRMHSLHVWHSEKYFICSNSELSENVTRNRTKMIFNRKNNSESIDETILLKQAMRYTTDWN